MALSRKNAKRGGDIMMHKTLPFQAIRVLTALTFATIIYLVLGPDIITYPLFFFFNVLLTIQVTQRQTVGMGRKRVGGTLLGSALGLLFYYLLPHHPLVVILYVGVAVITSYFFFQMYVGIVGVIGIMLILDAAKGLPLDYVLGRLFGAVLGVVVALIVVALVKRKKAESYQRFEAEAKQLFENYEKIIVQLFETSMTRQALEQALIPQITKLRDLRYKLLDEDNDLTSLENEKMLDIIDKFADMYMHARVINRTGGKLTDISRELLKENFHIEKIEHKERMYENEVLLNIHTQKLCLIVPELEKVL